MAKKHAAQATNNPAAVEHKTAVKKSAPTPAAVTEPVWHSPHVHPTEGMTVEMEAHGEVVPGRHIDGAWKNEAGQSVSISRWRKRT
jgi:hypothetical protein